MRVPAPAPLGRFRGSLLAVYVHASIHHPSVRGVQLKILEKMTQLIIEHQGTENTSTMGTENPSFTGVLVR